MRHLRLLPFAFAFVLVSCRDARVDKAEADLVLARGRIAALKSKQKKLQMQHKQSETSRSMLSEQAAEATLATAQLNAAEDLLDGKELWPAFALPGILESKDPAAISAFAGQAVKDVLPCPQEGDPSGDYDRGYDCDPPPLEDACEGVSQRNALSNKLQCTNMVAGTAKQPAMLLCSVDADYPPAWPLRDVKEAPELETRRTLVRAAFSYEGYLFVADFPAPNLDTYQPKNEAGLAECANRNAVLKCERACDERFSRLERPNCGREPDYGGDAEAEESGAPEDEPDEDPAVRTARLAAEAAAEREAEAAREAEEARSELEYQSCQSQCREEPAAAQVTATDTLQYVSSPVPGVLAFTRTIEHPTADPGRVEQLRADAERVPVEEQQKLRDQADAEEQKKETLRFLTLLSFPQYRSLAAGDSPVPDGAAKNEVSSLEKLLELRDGVLKATAKDGKRLVYGLDSGKLQTLALTKEGALDPLDAAATCAEIKTDAEASDDVKEACTKVAP